MIPVKTRPRFKCDFCNHRSIKWAMIKHEKRCYKNPDRYCEYCDNKGETTDCIGDLVEEGDCGLSNTEPCPYCKTAEEVKEIMKKEEEERKKIEAMPSIDIKEIPF